MKRTLMAACLAVAFAVSVAAQTPATSPGQSQPGAKADRPAAAEKSVTLKGCLRAGTQADTFELANASPATEAAGTAGTAAGAAPAIKNETVRLIGAPAGMNLKDHVGHTVEITGMIVPQGAKSSSPAGTAGTPPGAGAATGAAPGAAGAETRMNVKSMKHVDTKCGQ